MKFSDNPFKKLIPGKKRSFWLFGKNGIAEMDILIQADEKPPTEGEEMVCYEPFHKLDKEPVLKKIVPGKVEELLHTFWDKKNPMLCVRCEQDHQEQDLIIPMLHSNYSLQPMLSQLHTDLTLIVLFLVFF